MKILKNNSFPNKDLSEKNKSGNNLRSILLFIQLEGFFLHQYLVNQLLYFGRITHCPDEGIKHKCLLKQKIIAVNGGLHCLGRKELA